MRRLVPGEWRYALNGALEGCKEKAPAMKKNIKRYDGAESIASEEPEDEADGGD